LSRGGGDRSYRLAWLAYAEFASRHRKKRGSEKISLLTWVGALMVYAGEPDAFDESETNLLQQATNDLAHGIVVLRAKLERTQTRGGKQELEAQLRQSQKREPMGTLAAASPTTTSTTPWLRS
jgi:hypothetical protein